MYKGIIVEQSLEDISILKSVQILDVENSTDSDWVLYRVNVNEDEIKKLAGYLKEEWYMHFWKNREVIVVFRNKIFHLNYDDKSTWKDALNYGISHGIAEEQLDFPIE
ncbi:MAG: hypothetical protein Q4D02_05385 [Clostridia bacterium]|nr:hypothetical protein [Clostridia bacterium]